MTQYLIMVTAIDNKGAIVQSFVVEVENVQNIVAQLENDGAVRVVLDIAIPYK